MDNGAIYNPQQILERVSNMTSVSEKADFLYSYVTTFLRSFPRPDDITLLINNLEDLSREAGYQKGIAQTHHCRGLYYNHKGNYTEELEFYSKAIQIYLEIDSSSELGNLLVDVANLYYSQSQHEKAISLFNEAISISEQANDLFVKARALANYGLLLLESLQHREAEKMLQEAIAIAQKHRYDLILTRASLNIARLYGEMGSVTKMESTIIGVMRHVRKYGDVSNTRWSLLSATIRMYLLKGDNKRAYRHLMKFSDFRVGGIPHPTVFFNFSSFHRAINEPLKAALCALKGIQLATQIGDPSTLIKGYQLLSVIYSEIGDYKNAFYFKLKREDIRNDKSLPGHYQDFYQSIKELKPINVFLSSKELGRQKSQHLFRQAFEMEFPEEASQKLAELTTKELEVLSILSFGINDKEIAERLFISVATVKTHLRSVYTKLDVKSRGEAIRMIYELKLFPNGNSAV
jgi:ATP/maltotriose-dependent transcriptional regulator MalT